MSEWSYGAAKGRIYRRLANHFEEMAAGTICPLTAARWLALLDATLWAADPEGDADAVERLAKGEQP